MRLDYVRRVLNLLVENLESESDSNVNLLWPLSDSKDIEILLLQLKSSTWRHSKISNSNVFLRSMLKYLLKVCSLDLYLKDIDFLNYSKIFVILR